MRVASYHSLNGREISRETVEQLLRDILREEAKKNHCIWLGATPKPPCMKLEKPSVAGIMERCCTLAKLPLCA
jgi:hypothetical protein